MLSSNFYSAVLALSTLLSQANGIVFSKCIRTCIDNSQYSNCQVTDIGCLCRVGRSSGSFLPDLVKCMHNSCIDIGVDILLAPLELACDIAGASLPDSAIDAAKSEASSLATETQTQIQTQTITATTEFTRVVQTTITKTEQGSTQIVVFPVTIERTKTVSGEPSTVTKGATVVSFSGSGSPSSGSSNSGSSTLSSILSSVVSSARSSSTSEESTTTILTSTTVLGEAVTSSIANTQSVAPSTSRTGQPSSETNSAPFMNTNAGGKTAAEGSWMGLVILVVMGAMWF